MFFDRKINETLKMCRCCFMCRHACPVFLATKLDVNTPRGHALLLSRIDEGLANWTGDMVDKVYQCSQCSLCKELCEFKWGEDLIVQAGREAIVDAGLAPGTVKELAGKLMGGGTAYSKPLRALQVRSRLDEGTQVDVLYFAGDTAFYEEPEIIEGTAVLLDRLGISWALLESGNSTGIELFELGYAREAKKAAKALAGRIRQINPRILVTGCPHAYRAFKELYPEWGITALKGIEIRHIAEYLAGKIADGELKFSKGPALPDVCYHDPCQLGRKMGIYDVPRDLIKAVTGCPPLELFHSKSEAECCGAGSVMHLTDPAVTMKMAQKRLESALEEKAKILVTACPNCKSVLVRAGKKMKCDIKILDIAEFVRSSL